MFDQLVKRSGAVWIYSAGRFAEERRAFLCDLNERGYLCGNRPGNESEGSGCLRSGRRASEKQEKWRDNPNLMEFLRKL